MHERRFAILGQPVDHSLSPMIHGQFFENHGLRASYERIEVSPERAQAVLGELAGADYAGFNVTFPLKGILVPWLGVLGPAAARLGAVNTLIRTDSGASGTAAFPFRGENTDGDGFCLYLEQDRGVDLSRTRFLLLGTGKTARSILLALEGRGVGDVRMVNRSRFSLEDSFMVALQGRNPGWSLACQADLDVQDYDRLFDVDWVVNATSLGLAGVEARFPWPLERLPGHCRAMDLNYHRTGRTPFLNAIPAGREGFDGSGMLIYQAARAFEHWWGFFPTLDGVRERLES